MHGSDSVGHFGNQLLAEGVVIGAKLVEEVLDSDGGGAEILHVDLAFVHID